MNEHNHSCAISSSVWVTEEDQPAHKRLQSWKASTFVFRRIKLFHLYLNEYANGKKPVVNYCFKDAMEPRLVVQF